MDVHSIEMTKNPYILLAVGWQNWLITHFRSIIAAKLIPSKVLCFPQMCTILRRVTLYILGTVWPQKGYVFMHFYWKIRMTKKKCSSQFLMFLNFLRPLRTVKNKFYTGFQKITFNFTCSKSRMMLGSKFTILWFKFD